MGVRIIIIFYITICVRRIPCHMADFAICHHEYSFKPKDGFLKEHSYPWLGFVPYVHMTTGLLHGSKAPRIILIQRQFVIGNVLDLLLLPKAYKLGNAVFGNYEREEIECGLTVEQIRSGNKCARAFLEVPLLDIKPHPEYTRFGVQNSLVLVRLLRPMKSPYVLPVCLPSFLQRKRLRQHKTVYLVDYTSTVPKYIEHEEMGLKTLKLYTNKDCKHRRHLAGLHTETITQILCTTGCGVRFGAPIITHTPDGRIELVGLAVESQPCEQSAMRNSLNLEPPVYLDIYPFVSWIVNVITAYYIPNIYPESFRMMDGGVYMMPKISALSQQDDRNSVKQRSGWNGRIFLTGNYCYKDRLIQKSMAAFFYTENIQVILDPANVDIRLSIYAGTHCEVTCARLVLPNRLTNPVISGVGSSNITLAFNCSYCPNKFNFTLVLTGKNSSRSV